MVDVVGSAKRASFTLWRLGVDHIATQSTSLGLLIRCPKGPLLRHVCLSLCTKSSCTMPSSGTRELAPWTSARTFWNSSRALQISAAPCVMPVCLISLWTALRFRRSASNVCTHHVSASRSDLLTLSLLLDSTNSRGYLQECWFSTFDFDSRSRFSPFGTRTCHWTCTFLCSRVKAWFRHSQRCRLM